MASRQGEDRTSRRDRGLLAEYNQTWEDFRHRTTVEMTILGVYFATFAGLVFAYSQSSDPAIRVVLAGGGILLSMGVGSLLLGERRAWSADITRLQELEAVLSGDGESERLVRIREYDRLWTKLGYSLSFPGSFLWYVILVIVSAGLFGALTGLAAGTWAPTRSPLFWVAGALISSLAISLYICQIMRATYTASIRAAGKQKPPPESPPTLAR